MDYLPRVFFDELLPRLMNAELIEIAIGGTFVLGPTLALLAVIAHMRLHVRDGVEPITNEQYERDLRRQTDYGVL